MHPLRTIVGLALKIYGIVVTGNRTTRTHGFFRILKRRNVRIGDRCEFNTGVIIQGRRDVRIEDDVVLSPGCILMDSGFDVDSFAVEGARKHIDSFILIKRGSWIGTGAIILPGVTVGEHSIVGAGSVVTKDVEPYTVVAGNPAKPLRKISTERGEVLGEDGKQGTER